MKIYLCAKTNGETTRYINLVKDLLRRWGHTVFAPTEQAYNEKAGAPEKEIYEQDLKGLESSDVVVAVGALGADCAWEIGYTQGRKVPVYWVLSELNTKPHPMLFSVPRIGTMEEFAEAFDDRKKSRSA